MSTIALRYEVERHSRVPIVGLTIHPVQSRWRESLICKVALMPLINAHIGFARDSMRSNGIQEYPFKKVNTLGFAAVFEENGRRLNATNISQRRRNR